MGIMLAQHLGMVGSKGHVHQRGFPALQRKTCTQAVDRNHSTEPEVSDLTRSFLYQLASGNDKKRHFSSYINKRLSQNYGNISLTTGSFKFWWCFILAALFYTIYMILSNDKIDFVKVIQNERFLKGLEFGQAFNPALLFIAALFLVWGIVHTCIVFSTDSLPLLHNFCRPQ